MTQLSCGSYITQHDLYPLEKVQRSFMPFQQVGPHVCCTQHPSSAKR